MSVYPTVRKFLDLSTHYLPERFFQPGAAPTLTGMYPTEYGMLLWVPDDPTDGIDPDDPEPDDDAAPEIVAVRVYARGLECDYIMFDADGAEVPRGDLPVYPRDAQGDDDDDDEPEPSAAPGDETAHYRGA